LHGREFRGEGRTKKDAKKKCAEEVLDCIMLKKYFKEKCPKIVLNALIPDKVYKCCSDIHEYTMSVKVSDDTLYGTGKSHI
jgi:hypothetical protein